MNERIHRALRGHRIRIFIRFFFLPLFSPRTRVLLPCLLKKRATPNDRELYFHFFPLLLPDEYPPKNSFHFLES